jgi:hypothetical protein
MTSPSLLDAWDAVAWSEILLARLESAAADLSGKQGLRDEKSWLDAAIERVRAAREGLGELRARVMALPELAPLVEEHAADLQASAVDTVERLQAGITFHAGGRAPILEALYGRLKLPALRRAERADFESFCRDFEKRLNSSYAKRMFADPALAFIGPVLEQVLAAFADWRAAWTPVAPSEDEARALRHELEAGARRLELPTRQARLLAEAALAPLRNAFEDSGLAQRARRRGLRPAVTQADDDASLASEAPAPDEPTPEERAELSKQQSATEGAETPELDAELEAQEHQPAGEEANPTPKASASPPLAAPRGKRGRAKQV